MTILSHHSYVFNKNIYGVPETQLVEVVPHVLRLWVLCSGHVFQLQEVALCWMLPVPFLSHPFHVCLQPSHHDKGNKSPKTHLRHLLSRQLSTENVLLIKVLDSNLKVSSNKQ